MLKNKLFLLFFIILSLGSLLFFVTKVWPQPPLSPLSQKASFFFRLNFFLSQKNLGTPQNYQTFPTLKKCRFFLNPEERPLQITLSLEKDLFFQVTSLQQILNTAKMEGRTVQVIDLSTNNPYVTFYPDNRN